MYIVTIKKWNGREFEEAQEIERISELPTIPEYVEAYEMNTPREETPWADMSGDFDYMIEIRNSEGDILDWDYTGRIIN